MSKLQQKEPADSLLTMDDIWKSFPGVVALAGARLEIAPGEAHALVGENGAGKTTLIRILTGALQGDRGRIVFGGQPVHFRSPQQAQASGISTIHQELNLVPLQSVAENVAMGREPHRWGIVQWRRMNEEAEAQLQRLGLSIDVTRPLGSYGTAVQQMVGLARTLSLESQLVVMDEPTSSLDEREVDVLFQAIGQLTSEGTSVLFISHRLDEITAICDRITVLRDGNTVLQQPIRNLNKLDIVASMLGRSAEQVSGVISQAEKQLSDQAAEVPQEGSDAPLLEARRLRRTPVLSDVNVALAPGEIVGLAGLLGSGRTETARAIFGADPLEAGQILMQGKPIRLRTPRDAIERQMGFCPEDRHLDGAIPVLSLKENLTLAALPQLSRYGVVSPGRQSEVVSRLMKKLNIHSSGPDQPMGELSGGNQQKVLLARWLCTQLRLFILDEPTRGIDVGTKDEIRRQIARLSSTGLAVLLISSDLEELVESCDRVFVLRDGATVAELNGEEVTERAIMEAMAKQQSRHESKAARD